jgi:hypothetical protein
MTTLAWYDIKPEDTKYGLLVGTMFRHFGDPNPFKQWCMSLHDTERGRKMAIKRALREYPGSDTLIFLVKGKEFFDRAVPQFDVVKEKGMAKGYVYEQDILSFIKEKRKSNK